ncbi:NAD(P)H-binding protein [Cedecea colo]|uniref:NAD-dependent epimerase/dehydratase family protein n=1 Tax=Cedecea colo TaxID=2552946 RepID=A0ABX0VL97_9ENTR|nr:NAD(P)H-binding protein [Cedecea colo]NIY47341.1 NAD-dependent epimerase/dehydratase family protein [Cedecea colo]
MILVLGITGKTGGAAARHLLMQGRKVRALVRDRAKAADWEKQGVELIDGDLSDAEAITRALQGVESAYVMLPPTRTPSRDFVESKKPIAAYARALKSAHLSRVVILSSYGAEKTSGLGSITANALLEQGLSDLPYPVAVIRAGGFYENFLYGLQTGQGGVLPVFNKKTDEKSPLTATDDIGAEAARLLTGPVWSGRRVIELGSLVSADEIAAQLGDVLKREVAARAVPREAWTDTLEQMGFPQGQTWGFEEMFDALNSHWIDFGAPGTERVEGTTTARQIFAAAKG